MVKRWDDPPGWGDGGDEVGRTLRAAERACDAVTRAVAVLRRLHADGRLGTAEFDDALQVVLDRTERKGEAFLDVLAACRRLRESGRRPPSDDAPGFDD